MGHNVVEDKTDDRTRIDRVIINSNCCYIVSDIQFLEKPNWVSWDDIRKCLNAAHKTNKKSGFEMRNSTISTEDLLETMKDAHCFVALVGDKVVGVSCVKIENKKKWYVRGPVIYYFGDGILPEYRGTDVYFGINELRDKFVRESGIKIHYFLTSEHNKTIIKINKKYGFKLVQYQPTKLKMANYYQVTMVRWDDGCPFPDWFLKFMFNLSKIVSKVFFKRK